MKDEINMYIKISVIEKVCCRAQEESTQYTGFWSLCGDGLLVLCLADVVRGPIAALCFLKHRLNTGPNAFSGNWDMG